MKTKKVFFGFLMILSVSISVVSCGKEVMSGTNVKSNSTPGDGANSRGNCGSWACCRRCACDECLFVKRFA